MKKILLLLATLLLLPCFVQAQIDIPAIARAPFFDIKRGAVWGGTGTQTGFNNNFVISLAPIPASNLCVYFHNRDSGSDSMTLPQVYGTSDGNVSTYTGNTNPWSQIVFTQFPQASALNGIGINAAAGMNINVAGFSKITLVLRGGVGSGTVDIYATVGTCGGLIYNTMSPSLPGVGFPTIQCDKSNSVSVAAGGQVVIGSGILNTYVYICNMQITVSSTITTSGALTLQASSSNASCTGVLQVGIWFPALSVGSPIIMGSNTGYIFGGSGEFQIGGAACLNNASTGGAVQVTISYTNL